MTALLRVLQVEDSPSDAKLVVHALRKAGWTVEATRVEDAASMRAALVQGTWDVVISDWTLPSFSGGAALTLVKEMSLDLPFFIVSGTVGEESAVQAMRAGARDYLLKDHLARLAPALERELHEAQARRDQRKNEEKLRHTEEQLRQTQKMEAIGGLAAGVAHDFNNLLCVILGAADLAISDLPTQNPLYETLTDIRSAAVRAADLTRQLLAFSRQQMLQPRKVDLNQIVGGVHKMLGRLIGEDIELLTVLSPGLGKTFVDPGQIEQVIINLAVNARDAMPDGGKLTIETADVVLDQEYVDDHPGAAAGPYVMLAVTDSGTGMDAATRARIFEPFFTTKEKGKGTGLGLSTVLGIVQQSEGMIWVYSEPGRGTTFKVYFPRSDREAADDISGPYQTSKGLRGSETILLVEDEEAVRKIASSILRRFGYTVVEAADGNQALTVVEQHPEPIHLLITDMVMPGMSGIEVAARIVQERPGIPTLFMSGYTDRAIVQHGFLESGRAFLQKPITSETLLRKVREVLALAAFGLPAGPR